MAYILTCFVGVTPLEWQYPWNQNSLLPLPPLHGFFEEKQEGTPFHFNSGRNEGLFWPTSDLVRRGLVISVLSSDGWVRLLGPGED